MALSTDPETLVSTAVMLGVALVIGYQTASIGIADPERLSLSRGHRNGRVWTTEPTLRTPKPATP